MNRYSRKCAIVILDGLGDLPAAQLGGKTPLEAAATPVMNRMASTGQYGLVDPIGPGIVPNTHSGCGVLFGVLPADLSRLRRGPLEASGAGRVLQPGEIAFRANFATLKDNGAGIEVVDRRAGRIDTDTGVLASGLDSVDLGDGVTSELYPTDQHRCVLVLKGPGLSPAVSDTDPGDGGMPALLEPSVALDESGARTAEKLNRFIDRAQEVLADHPVNAKRVKAGELPATGVLTRGAGEGFDLRNLVQEKGLKAVVVAGCNTVIGLARTVGFEVVTDPRFTAAADTDLIAKMDSVVAALDQNDLVYLHIKAPDLFAHDHQPDNKRKFLECVDEAMERLGQAGCMIAIAADHTTDSNTGAHTADPIPALFYDPAADCAGNAGPLVFGESLCAVGNMPRQSSHDFLARVLGAMAITNSH